MESPKGDNINITVSYDEVRKMEKMLNDNLIYPCTIVQDRYGGTYSKARWLAFNMERDQIPSVIGGSDIEELEFWDAIEWEDEYMGKGDTPNEAVLDLREKIEKKLKPPKPETKLYEVWTEGYAATGERSGAICHTVTNADYMHGNEKPIYKTVNRDIIERDIEGIIINNIYCDDEGYQVATKEITDYIIKIINQHRNHIDSLLKEQAVEYQEFLDSKPTLTDQVVYNLNHDKRFNSLGKGNNLGVWATYVSEGDYNIIDFEKPMGKKTFGKARIILFREIEEGLELKIELWLPSYCEWYTFFEGFVESIDEWYLLLKMVGLKAD